MREKQIVDSSVTATINAPFDKIDLLSKFWKSMRSSFA
jgi:hypothetical protein